MNKLLLRNLDRPFYDFSLVAAVGRDRYKMINGMPVSYTDDTFEGSVWAVRTGATGAISLPKTGQTTSYAERDDGNLQIGVEWPSPRFLDNGFGALTDLLTGLMWQQVCDDVPRRWDPALSYCEELELAGNGDWRLPSISELQTLVDYGRSEPAIDSDVFEGNLTANYSSSTTREKVSTEHWSIEFGQGYMYFYDKAGHSSYVRCVR